jgi:hypothetical protein
MTQNSIWPKRTTIYLHRDKESNYDLANDLGLSEDATSRMRYLGYEVEVTIDVYEDGRVLATHFGSLPLSKPLEI